jgi:hypothetical protein
MNLDTYCVEKAMREFRVRFNSPAKFSELSPVAQSQILLRAQEIKEEEAQPSSPCATAALSSESERGGASPNGGGL